MGQFNAVNAVTGIMSYYTDYTDSTETLTIMNWDGPSQTLHWNGTTWVDQSDDDPNGRLW